MHLLKPKIFILLSALALLIVSIAFIFYEATKGSRLYHELSTINDLTRLKEYLDTDDEQDARIVIRRISDVGKSHSIDLLGNLWVGGEILQNLKYKDTYKNPVARLVLAEQLFSLTGKKEYADYIKKFAHDEDWIVQKTAASALAEVKDAEAVKLLTEIAMSENNLVARVAIDSLFRLNGQEGINLGVPDVIKKLKATITDSELKDYLKNREASLKSKVNSPIIYTDPLDQMTAAPLESGNYQGAIDLLLPYAKQNNIRAQFLVGTFSQFTKPANYKNAVKWLTSAANAEYAPAKVALAFCYIDGNGVEENVGKAVQLLQEAERQGDETAKQTLDMAKRKGWWGLSPE